MTTPDDDTTSEDRPGSVRVTVQTAADSVVPGEQTTAYVLVEGADAGVSAYETSLHTGGGRIEDATATGDPAVPVVDVRDDNTTAAVAAAMGPDSGHGPAETVTIATVTVTVTAAADESLDLSVDDHTEVAPMGDSSDRYTVDDCGGVTLAIETPDR